MKFLKDTLKAGAIAAVIAGCATLAQVQSASALSLNFKPTGTSVDGDLAKDIVTSPGATINFDLWLETFGVASDDTVSKVDYNLTWDTNELGIVGFNPLSQITGSVGFGNYNLTQTFASALAPDLNTKIATVSFNVLSGLNNDSNADFTTKFLAAYKGNALLANVTGTQTQSVEVQPVPTPALIPGIAAMGLSLLRKRKQAEAAA
jgi:hypothetical protein